MQIERLRAAGQEKSLAAPIALGTFAIILIVYALRKELIQLSAGLQKMGGGASMNMPSFSKKLKSDEPPEKPTLEAPPSGWDFTPENAEKERASSRIRAALDMGKISM